MTVDAEEIDFTSLREAIERNFRHIAESKGLPFEVSFLTNLPRSITTDPKRLQQILKNLLSNAFKFTAKGEVTVTVDVARDGWTPSHAVLTRVPQVIAFRISDTGIGIAPEKQKLIFEAFQQADAGTSRKYGGTGLGLAISRELATLLGGEIRLNSAPGHGSTFTLYLPAYYNEPTAEKGTRLALPTAPLPAPRDEVVPSDLDREQGPAGRPMPVDCPRTIRTMPACCSIWPGKKDSRESSPPAAARRSPSPANTCRPPSRSMSSCPTCWAGRS